MTDPRTGVPGQRGGAMTHVLLHCNDCHAADPYTCQSVATWRGDFSDDTGECHCPCHDGAAECGACGADAEWEDCWNCDSEGMSHHNCGEDACCCLHPEPNVRCDICDGAGGWWTCTANCAPAAPVPATGMEMSDGKRNG